MSYEDLECPICNQVGKNAIESYPVTGHPNVEEEWVVCECGHDIKAVTE